MESHLARCARRVYATYRYKYVPTEHNSPAPERALGFRTGFRVQIGGSQAGFSPATVRICQGERGAALGRWRSVRVGLVVSLFAGVAGGLGGGGIAGTRSAGAAGSIPSPAMLAAGNGHSCAVLPARTVKCWGLNGDGELGDGTTANASKPATVTALTGVIAVTTGDSLLRAARPRHREVWGYNFHGELGVGRKGPTVCARRPGLSGQPCSTTPGRRRGLERCDRAVGRRVSNVTSSRSER